MTKIQKHRWLVLAGAAALVVLIALSIKKHPQQPPMVAPEDGAAPAAETQSPKNSSSAKSPAKVTTTPSKPAATNSQPKELILDLSTPFAQAYNIELSRFLDRPADFDQHFIVAKWQCGGDCAVAAVIDRNTGKVYRAPTDHYSSVRPPDSFVPYTLADNRYKIVNGDVIETYVFDGTRFVFSDIEEL